MSYAASFSGELERAVNLRIASIVETIAELRGSLSPGRGSIHRAFEVFEKFDDHFNSGIAKILEEMSDDETRNSALLAMLRHLVVVADFIESYLAHGERRELNQALSDEIEDEFNALHLDNYRAVLSHGPAANFVTTYGDIYQHLYGAFSNSSTASEIFSCHLALFRVPRIEGAGVYWKPILIGHEIAHVYESTNRVSEGFNLDRRFDHSAAMNVMLPGSSSLNPIQKAHRLFEIARSWLVELLCDLYALHRYGIASIAALGEYLSAIGAWRHSSKSHPPGVLRLRLLLSALPDITDPDLEKILVPWTSLIAATEPLEEDWARLLDDLFMVHQDDLLLLGSTWPSSRYEIMERADAVRQLADLFGAGMVAPDLTSEGASHPLAADVVNAAWLARIEGDNDAEIDRTIDKLARKSLENIRFVQQWTDAGGQMPRISRSELNETLEPHFGALSMSELQIRLSDPDLGRRLYVSPLLQLPKGAGLDLRLGYRFILFRRSHETSFDPLAGDRDPRRIQVYRELARSEQIVLHPNEMVLASTLEFIVLPPNLTAQVITRSSYGRLGLLSATAVQVHPNFHGCLTLELANLSNLPLVLTPGERVAQLVTWNTSPVEPEEEKYHCPIGPEFSKVRTDRESEILRTLSASS